MDIALHALGLAGSEREVVDAVAAGAQRAGFATLWVGDVGCDDWLDPFLTLSFAAAATTTIELATANLKLPEHNLELAAKHATSLARASAGRVTLGLEIDAATQEFATMLTPRVGAPRIPVVVGGTGEATLYHTATWSDGWYGRGLADVEEAAECASALRRFTRILGRDPGDLRLSVALREPIPGDVGRLADVGVDEMVLEAHAPTDAAEATHWVNELAEQWMWVLT